MDCECVRADCRSGRVIAGIGNEKAKFGGVLNWGDFREVVGAVLSLFCELGRSRRQLTFVKGGGIY